MRLGKLIELQDHGTFKVKEIDNVLTVGHVYLDDTNCRMFLSKLSWLEYSKTPIEIVKETDKFLNGIKGAVNNPFILENTEVTFQNKRKENTVSYFNRIKLVCNGKFDITVLIGMGGVGGRYGVYSSTNNFVKPVFACKTGKQLGEWINKLVK